MDRLLEATYQAETRHFWFRGFRWFVKPWLTRAAAARPNLVLLDCGCGTGSNLALLEACGQAFGFDLSARGLELARTSGRRRLGRARIDAIPFPDETFDVVTSFDVLYALPDGVEARAVAEMYRVLRPGGSLIVNVAANRMLTGDHSVLSQEQRRYTRPQLRVLLEHAGFVIKRISYTNASLFPLLLAVRTTQRAIGLSVSERANREITVPPAPVNATLTALLALEAVLLRWIDMPFGSSLLCWASKPSLAEQSASSHALRGAGRSSRS